MSDSREPAPEVTPESAPGNAPGHYRVLARKYRPSDFSGLIGQEAMVRTLRNAIAQNRLAHGFMLTGVRGIGKTTTARILARAFNCATGPTADPCGRCEHCRAIAEDRHVDVIEMDAASRTGIDDVRELIDGVRYRPVSARFKIYIVDEVHMLSEKAFNALLKTLEEPPPHVKFIFATTEIRKVPVTVLSRCQRFDLRRIEAAELARHFAGIAKAEGVEIAPEALALIARAADGSARDGLSLLDQAIAMAAGPVTAEQVRDMLGLADRGQLFDLFAATMSGKAAEALALLGQLHRSGADPAIVIGDLLELTHWLTRIKIVPGLLEDPALPEAERRSGRDFAEKLSLPVLARAWQMLLKGLSEIQAAPLALAAAEMVLIRLIHMADQPTPGDLLRRWAEGSAPASSPSPNPAPAPSPAPSRSRSSGGDQFPPMAAAIGAAAAQPAAAPQARPREEGRPQPQSFADIVELVREKREGLLLAALRTDFHLVDFDAASEIGRIEFRPGPQAPANLAQRLGQCLLEWTGKRWVVAISNAAGQPTLKEQEAADFAVRKAEAAIHPLVAAVLAAFPGAKIEALRDLAPSAEEDASAP